MDQLKGLPLGRQLVLGAGVLLFIDTFLPWQKVGPFSWTAWHGFWGVMLALLTIALLAWTAALVVKFELPFRLPEGLTTLVAAAVILLFAVIKTLADSYTGWAAYVGIVLAAGMVYGAWLTFQASGESLPDFKAMSQTGTGTSAATPATPAAPAAPAEGTPPPVETQTDAPPGADPV